MFSVQLKSSRCLHAFSLITDRAIVVTVRQRGLNVESLVLASTQATGSKSSETATTQQHTEDNALDHKLQQLISPPHMKDNPHVFDRLITRFRGIPLKGEAKPYETMFKKNLEEVWVAPIPLPPMPKDFKEHPERDLVNFPYPARFMYAPKTRMLMFPDSWFTAFYNVTGVSGPYLLMLGTFAFLFNKELIVMDDHYLWTTLIIGSYVVFSRAFSHQVNNYLFKKVGEKYDKFKKIMETEMAECHKNKKDVDDTIDSLKLIKQNYRSIFKENVAVQLEAAYRANIERVNAEMKRRIGYLSETQETKNRFVRNHMLQWIINSIRKEIQTNKDGIKDKFMDNCIQQLKAVQIK